MRPFGRCLRRSAAPLIITCVLAGTLAACGSDDDGDDETSAARPAPPASDFPATEGRTLEQVLGAAQGEGPVVSPAARVLREGENRFPFGVFSVEREPITAAQVAIYAAPGGLKGPAEGPYPARIEDLHTESAFRAKSTADDPDAAPVAYVTDIPLDKPGEWTFAALIKEGDSYSASLLPTPSLVGEFEPPGAGDRAPASRPPPRTTSPTSPRSIPASPRGRCTTRTSPTSSERSRSSSALRHPGALPEPHLRSRVVDIAEQVKRDFGDQVAFIHQEVYVDNNVDKGAATPDEGLPTCRASRGCS